MTVTGAQAYAFTSIDLSVVRTTLYTPWTPAPEEPTTPLAVPSSRAARKADALFVALDTDQDGSITGQEFTEGARALLRGARDGHRPRRAQAEHHGNHESKATHRLERKLERLFDRLDTDGDGAATNEELLAALERGGPQRGPSQPTPPVSSVYVAIAIRSYGVVEQLA